MTGRTVRIEKLAPTGEGVARTGDGVGFVDRALPGELVETNVYQVKKRFWRGSLGAVREPSPDRLGGPHASCAGCDWAHYEAAAARRAKRELFLETMERIGRIEPSRFGALTVEASPPGYRLRTRLHAAGGEPGFFSPGTHRVVSARDCEAIAAETRRLLPGIGDVIAKGSSGGSEVAILENIEGTGRLLRVRLEGAPPAPAAPARIAERLSGSFAGARILSADGQTLAESGEDALTLRVGGRAFSVAVDTFFQGNRHLVDPLYEAVRDEARLLAPGEALDAFGGAGLFAAALLDAGHRVVSVESDPGAAKDAARTLEDWPDAERCEPVLADMGVFLARDSRRFDCVVADPPRTGLGLPLSRELSRRARRALLYVSCDPATLARDLSAILAEGFEIRAARLFDLFAFTHRVEALVSLQRAA